MLTDKKRKKLLAGVLAAVMLTSTAGCGFDDKDSEAQGDAAQEEKKDGGSSGGFFSGFFPWYFIGRTFGVGPMAGVRQAAPAPGQNQSHQQQTAAGGAGAAANRADGKSTGSTVQQGSTTATQKSTLGSTGSSGKSGIGSGLSRSSGSAIS